MENYSKFIDEALKKLNWDHIMKYYESLEVIEEDASSKKKKRVRLKTKDVFSVKKELKDLIKFVMSCDINEVEQDNWIISWVKKESGHTLEIVFTPTRCIMSDDESLLFEEDDQLSSEELERDALENMLKKSIKEENYELSSVIHSILKKMDKNIKAHANKSV